MKVEGFEVEIFVMLTKKQPCNSLILRLLFNKIMHWYDLMLLYVYFVSTSTSTSIFDVYG
jgi:hypothetical protein